MTKSSLVLGAMLAASVACHGPDSPPPSGAAAPPTETASGPAPPPASAALPVASRPRVVFLGDSLTAGYGIEISQSVPSLIQERLNASGYRYEVVNAGVSGDTSAGGLSRLDWSLSGDVAVLVIELGANDGLRGLPVPAMKQNLSEIIRRAQARHITVLLTGMEAPPNYGVSYTAEFRKVFADLAAEYRVAFVPFYLDGVAGRRALNIADGIHPNAAGARIVAETVWRQLEPLLNKS